MARRGRANREDSGTGNGPIGPPPIGPAALGEGPIGGRSRRPRQRRSTAGTALLLAWLSLVGLIAAGGLYAFWPQLETQVAALTGGPVPPDEAVAVREVGPSPAVPPIADAPPEPDPATAGPTETGAEPAPEGQALDLADPQATTLPRAGRPDPQAAADATEGAAPASPDASASDGASAGAAEDQVAALPRDPAPPPAPPPPQEPAWQRYATPFTAPTGRPLIAVVLTGLGLNGPRTLQAIEQLPPQVSLSFSPYGKQTEAFMRTARAFGHEVLLDLPMEPASADDPGTLAMLTSLTPGANLERLDIVLTRGRGYVGVVGSLGARFVSNPVALEPVLAELARRGLLYLDNRPLDAPLGARVAGEMGIPVAINDRSLDARMASTPAVEARLAQVERIARERGTAVALGEPNPTTIAQLREWVATLPGKGLALAPVTAVANTQPIR